MKVPEIKKVMSGLSPSEIQEVVDYGLYLQSTKGKTYNREEELLFDAYVTLLKKEGVAMIPYQKFKSSNSYQRLRESFKTIEHFINQNFDSLTITQRMKFYHIVLTQMVEYVRRLPDVPVSFNTVSVHSDKVAGLVDAAFPGYIRSKLFKKILLENS
jgi:hypothetical protein